MVVPCVILEFLKALYSGIQYINTFILLLHQIFQQGEPCLSLNNIPLKKLILEGLRSEWKTICSCFTTFPFASL